MARKQDTMICHILIHFTSGLALAIRSVKKFDLTYSTSLVEGEGRVTGYEYELAPDDKRKSVPFFEVIDWRHVIAVERCNLDDPRFS